MPQASIVVPPDYSVRVRSLRERLQLTQTQLAKLIVAALQSRTDWTGQFSVVEAGRIRMTPLPPPPTP